MADGGEHRPTFRETLNALTPPGTDQSALFRALKAAQATPAPGAVPDVSFRPESRMRHCVNCGTAHDYVAQCPPLRRGEGCRICSAPLIYDFGAGTLRCASCTGDQPQHHSGAVHAPPEDPFTAGQVAGVGLTEMLADMTAAGMPLASAERILGAMLAAYGLMAADAEGPHAQH